MTSRRRVAVVSTSRADYGHLYWVLRDLQAHPGVDPKLIAMGAHLAPEFGRTLDRIEADDIPVDERVECLLSSDSDVGMAKTLGVATLGLAEVLARLRPDLLLLIADRYELLAPASVALTLRIPVAHIEGGEVSQGAIDDAVRNALTKLSHLHFAPTPTAARRILALGEEAWRVHTVGAPSLDHLRRSALPARDAVERALGMSLEKETLVVAVHPVTLLRDTLAEADAVFAALARLPHPIVFCFPNADAGGRALVERARRFCAQRDDASLFVNLEHRVYWGLLRHAALLLGNSSSGIMESASLALPTVNVGMRQQGRERAANVLDCEPEAASIARAVTRALAPEFRASLAGMANPYGDGRAAERIAKILATVELGEPLLMKAPVAPNPGPADARAGTA